MNWIDRKALILSLFVCISLSWAQGDVPPPLNPYDSPWGKPSAEPEANPGSPGAKPSPSTPSFGSPFPHCA